jgi:transcriptional regulator with XRE-family HTH domain
VSARGCAPKGSFVSIGIGARLRTIRQQWHLSLREVEERSLRLAQEWGSSSYQVSASWLVRLEREEHNLTVSKLIALANIYNTSAEQLLHSICPEKSHPVLRQPSSPNVTMLLREGPLDDQAKCLLGDTLGIEPIPDATSLLPISGGLSQAPHRRGIIGTRDRFLEPMIPAGSIVHIDTQKRGISSRKDWKHEFQRPIHFLMTRQGYVCGWCELDRNSEWLTLIPHPLSPASSRRWKYQTEIENVGRVTAVAIKLRE